MRATARTFQQARWVKTVKVLLRIAKSSQDQTVGSTLLLKSWIAIDWVTCRSVFTSTGLMYSQAIVTLTSIEESNAGVIGRIEN